MSTFHDFSTRSLTGEPVDLSTFKGKKLLVVNTASECGLTPQYKVLQEVFDTFGGDGFTIIGFPANNFGSQEPGTNDQIQAFCEANYGVTFPMMSKISVKGADTDPIYQWLTQKEQNGKADVEMTWNFQKFLVDENGEWVDFLTPTDSPADSRVLDWIQS